MRFIHWSKVFHPLLNFWCICTVLLLYLLIYTSFTPSGANQLNIWKTDKRLKIRKHILWFDTWLKIKVKSDNIVYQLHITILHYINNTNIFSQNQPYIYKMFKKIDDFKLDPIKWNKHKCWSCYSFFKKKERNIEKNKNRKQHIFPFKTLYK